MSDSTPFTSAPHDSAVIRFTGIQSDPESLVYHVILFILAFIGLFALLRLPRALARFSKSSEWSTGHFLWHTSYRRSRPPPNRSCTVEYPFGASSSKDTKETSTDGSHTLYSYATRAGGRRGDNGAGASYPPHIATCPRFLRPLLALHRFRIDTGFSISQVLIMTFYFSVMVYAGFYKSSPFSDPLRTGWVAAAQLPFVFALATKNNILGMLLGFTYEKVSICQHLYALGD